MAQKATLKIQHQRCWHFFLNDDEEHGLGSLVLKALITCLPEPLQHIDPSLSTPPKREVVTNSGKRIDLLLESDQWAIVMENKINHTQNNPFGDYEAFVYNNDDSDRFKEKEKIFIVLSPTGKAPQKHPKWLGVSYSEFIPAIKQNLSEYFINQPPNKWMFALREFILHLEANMATPTPQETIDFVFKKWKDLKGLEKLRIETRKNYKQELQERIQENFSQKVNISFEEWDKCPTFYISLDPLRVQTVSHVALCLEEHHVRIHCYALLTDKAHANVADKFFDINHNKKDQWLEAEHKTYRHITTNFSQENIVKLLTES